MKKLIWFALALCLFLTACARPITIETPVYQDGIYTAQTEGFSDSGWQDVVTVTVENGRIIDVAWDSYNEEGESKRALSQSGEYGMVAGGARSEWHEQADSIEEALIREQDPTALAVNSTGKVDGISGVSITVSEFVTLAGQALNDAK